MLTNIFTYNGKTPKVAEGTYIDPTARLVGDVEIADGSAVWYGSLVKGEGKPTRIGSECAILEQCFVEDSLLQRRVIVSHRALLHRCIVGEEVLISIGAVILDGASIGRRSIVGAGCLVTAGSVIAPDSVVIGSPARVLREVTEKDKEVFQKALQEVMEKIKIYAGTTSLPPKHQ